MAAPTICGNNIPVLNGCPPDSAQLLVFLPTSSAFPDGVALLNWAAARCCWISQIFGAGIIAFTGGDLDSQGRYYNDRFTQSLRVYAENTPNFLNDPDEWNYILDIDGRVIGVKILIGYNADDVFLVFPNPICSDLVPPEEALSGLNEVIYGSDTDEYILYVTEERRLRFGNELSIQLWIDNNGDGNYEFQSGFAAKPDISPNPNYYTIGGLGLLNFKLVIT